MKPVPGTMQKGGAGFQTAHRTLVRSRSGAEKEAVVIKLLRPFVAGGGKTPLSQEEAAAKLGVAIATLRTWLSRLRQRYREALRTEVANTVWLSTDQLRKLSDEILS
jgi:transposase-like protein